MIEIDSLRNHSNFDNRIVWRDANRTLEDSEFLFLTKRMHYATKSR